MRESERARERESEREREREREIEIEIEIERERERESERKMKKTILTLLGEDLVHTLASVSSSFCTACCSAARSVSLSAASRALRLAVSAWNHAASLLACRTIKQKEIISSLLQL